MRETFPSFPVHAQPAFSRTCQEAHSLISLSMFLYGCTVPAYFFNQDVGPALQPAFVLGVEMEELGIQAGLQDRVVQVMEKNNQHVDGLVQDCSNFSAVAMELLQSCTKPSISYLHFISSFNTAAKAVETLPLGRQSESDKVIVNESVWNLNYISLQ